MIDSKCVECCNKCQENEREEFKIQNVNWLNVKKKLENNNTYNNLIKRK